MKKTKSILKQTTMTIEEPDPILGSLMSGLAEAQQLGKASQIPA
jgi:hypothetical protein